MDYASQEDERGSVAGFDAETYAVFSGFEESDIEAVITATAVDPVAARRLLIAKVDANGIRQLQHLAGPLFDLIDKFGQIDRRGWIKFDGVKKIAEHG